MLKLYVSLKKKEEKKLILFLQREIVAFDK